MVIQFIAPVVGHFARIGITSASLKAAGGTFAQSLPFGAGYSFGTYLGFPKNYGDTTNFKKTQTVYLNRKEMPYGQRKIRVWSRRYRKYIWVYPRRNNYRRSSYYRRRY